MSRILRLIILLVVATILSTRLPVNLVVVVVAALAMIDLTLTDIVGFIFASLCLDYMSILPLGFSFCPILMMVICLQVLRSQIYVQSGMSRLLWGTIGILVFNLVWVGLLALRGDTTFYVWSGVILGMARSAGEIILAAAAAPLLRWYLTVTWADLTKPQSIVVH